MQQIEAARAKIALSMTPPTKRQVSGWLAELSVITARRSDDDMTEELRAAAYSKRLAEYPADIARHALLVARWKFFPTWAEVADVCEGMMKRRKLIGLALDKAERDLKARQGETRKVDSKTAQERAAFAATLVKRFDHGGR